MSAGIAAFARQMPIEEAVRESGATIFSIAGLLKLFLSIPRGLESSSTQVSVAA
jgi:hypothetical protein